MDTVIPVAFPDYLIAVATPKVIVDLLPWFTFDDVTIHATNQRVPELGHAGVLFFDANGLTKYYEYGRYDPPKNLGLVRRLPIPDLTLVNGRPTDQSLGAVLLAIARKAGQGGRIQGVYIEVPGKFAAMSKYAQLRQKQNSNPKRAPYSLWTNSCVHFVKSVVKAAGVATPWMLDPRPNSYIGEFRSDFPDLDYDARSRALVRGT
jgi:hypothetical protein